MASTQSLERGGDPAQPWNSSNAKSFLEFIRDEPEDLSFLTGLEFGNELNFFGVSPQDHAAGLRELDNIARNLFPSQHERRFRILGPDMTNWDRNFFKTFLPLVHDIIWGVTWHSYPLGPGYNNPDLDKKVLSPSSLDSFTQEASQAADQVRQFAGLQLVMGEIGGAYNSGHNNTNNRFIDAFWYLRAMGALAEKGHAMFCRQTLLGGNYELIDKQTLLPNPSYFAAWLFHKVMGRQVLQVKTSDQSAARAYVHCNILQKRLGLLVLNFSPNTTLAVTLLPSLLKSANLSNDSLVPREEYAVTSATGDVHSRTIRVNGKTVHVSETGQFQINPKIVTQGETAHISVSGHSYSFVHFSQEAPISKHFCFQVNVEATR